MATTSSEPEREQPRAEEATRPRSPGSARRNLFGPVDHQQLQQDFQRLLCAGAEAANRRWNFDFQRDRPARGPVAWEEVRGQDVPAFYRSCVAKAPAPSARRTGTPGGEGQAAPSPAEDYLEVTAKYTGQKPRKRVQPHRGVKRKQATIPDFFIVKKRRFLHHKRLIRQ